MLKKSRLEVSGESLEGKGQKKQKAALPLKWGGLVVMRYLGE